MPEPASPVAAGDDWPGQAAETIVRVVGQVRDRTTGPAITASRAVVFGLLAALLGTVALTVLSIVAVRGAVIGVGALLDVADLDHPGRAVWIAHLLVGVVFVLGGLVLWKRAVARPG